MMGMIYHRKVKIFKRAWNKRKDKMKIKMDK